MDSKRNIPTHPKGYRNDWGAVLQRQDELQRQLEKEERTLDKEKRRKQREELDEQLQERRRRNQGSQPPEQRNTIERQEIQNRIDESVRKEQLEHSKKRAMALSIENENRELYVAIELTTCAGCSRSACKRSSWRTRSTAI